MTAIPTIPLERFDLRVDVTFVILALYLIALFLNSLSDNPPLTVQEVKRLFEVEAKENEGEEPEDREPR